MQRLFGGIGVNDPLQYLNAPIVKDYVDENAFSQYKKDLSQVRLPFENQAPNA